MGSDGTFNSILDRIKSWLIFALIIIVAGFFVYLVWTLIKIPLWYLSPYRGSFNTRRSDVMKISFSRAMKTPYSFAMIWSGGWMALFALVIIMALSRPESPVWHSDACRWAIYSFTAIGGAVFLWGLILELNMLFNFRSWVNNMVDLGQNPLE